MSVVAIVAGVLMDAALERKFITRFQALTGKQSILDFDRAVLAREIRAAFPPTEDGEFQFRLWLVRRLGVRGNTVTRLSNLIRALEMFPTLTEWESLGGARGVIFLTGLSGMARARLVAQVKRDGGAVTYTQLRTMAKAAGYITARPRRAGSKLRGKLDTLRLFVQSLYEKHKNLGKMPVAVQDALS